MLSGWRENHMSPIATEAISLCAHSNLKKTSPFHAVCIIAVFQTFNMALQQKRKGIPNAENMSYRAIAKYCR